MRKFTTVLAAMLLALSMMAMPAMADDAKTLEQLQQELDDAKDEVIRLEGVVAELEDDLADAEKAVADQQKVVDDLNDDLVEAKNDLADAKTARQEAYSALTAFGNTYKDGECNNRFGEKVACEAALLTYDEAGTAVGDADAAVKTIQAAVTDAEKDLKVLEADVDRLVVLLDGDDDNLGARQELLEAQEAEAAAALALSLYVPPTAEVHPGCKGIVNAQTKASKGNAPVALAAVAAKLKCTA
jgi:t-SNARE complex subunit (syntaxin)